MTMDRLGKPSVSVILPVRNESRHLARCLESIIASDYPPGDFEILVVDGMSEDETRTIAESFRTAHPKLRVIDNPRRIVSTALNLGIREAEGKTIIRVDGHGKIAPNFIRTCVETLENVPEAGCVGGHMEAEGETLIGRSIAEAQSSFFGGGGGAWYRARKAGYVDTVPNGAYRRSVFDVVGLFDETLVRDQDDEFNYRLREAGYKIYFNPGIRNVYYARSSLVKLASQYFQYGFWKVRVFKQRARVIQPRQLAPPLFAAAIALLLAASWVSPAAGLALQFVCGLYVTLSLAASVVLGMRKGWKMIFVLPLAFGAMHLGYGFGFWAGALYFAAKKGA